VHLALLFYMIKQKINLLYLKIFVVAFAAYGFFWNLGHKPLAEWDESRYGQIAVEMLRNGDFINYYYNGEPEFWTAKPPLSIWSIVTSYKIFGLNEFAMRLPATLAGILALYFLYRLLTLYLTELFVWFALLIGITSKTIIGPHVSRSGDTDAFLIAGLFAFLFFFAKFFREGRGKNLFWAGLALGLAFFAKGFAIGFFFPVAVGLLIYKKNWKRFITSRMAYVAVMVFLIFPVGWMWAVSQYGNRDTSAQYGGKNAIEVMVLFDLVGRLTGAIDSGKTGIDAGFLPRAMDIRFGIWWGLFGFLVFYYVFKKWGEIRGSENNQVQIFLSSSTRNESFVISLTGFISILFLLFVSVVKLDWYLAPLLPFFLLLFMHGYGFLIETKKKLALFIAAIGIICGVATQIQYVSLDEANFPFREFIAANAHQLESASQVQVSRKLRQNEMLYVSWVHAKPITVAEDSDNRILGLNCHQNVCLISVY
jgi:4-amino-4-deoxy-L-arabinose transferase-like glycosyltransferase